jgi:hypothetical protein
VQLRCRGSVSWERTTLPANSRLPLEGLGGAALDLELVIHRGHSFVAGLMLQSWNSGQGSAAILYDWENSLLEVRTAAALVIAPFVEQLTILSDWENSLLEVRTRTSAGLRAAQRACRRGRLWLL